ncbi:MAG: hypothetical protein HOP13_02310 [Alphaproteobacteria bacterium]|nr:hypothetical protein [Alphaproteobacteria bacterium]
MTTPHNETDDELMARHDRNVSVVTEAVAGLLPRFASKGMTPVCVFEGAIKGGTLALMATGSTPAEVADLLEEAVDELRRIHGVTKSRH